MDRKRFILAINPYYTYTKIGIFNEKGKLILLNKIPFAHNSIKKYYNQKDFRVGDIMAFLKSCGLSLGEFKSIVGIGGLLRPMPGGTYKITPKILEDLRIGYGGEHISNLGALIAYDIGNKANVHSFIVASMTVDELYKEARVTGLPNVQRTALSYVLSMKYSASIICEKIDKSLKSSSFIIAQLGEDISTIALKNGKLVDMNNFYDEGTFSLHGCGAIPPLKLAKLAFQYKGDYRTFSTELFSKGGLMDYMNTEDIDQVYNNLSAEEACSGKYANIVESLSYNIAKDIGAMAAVLNFKVDRIILTGSLSSNHKIVSEIEKRVEFISPVEILEGTFEMEAMIAGVLRVLKDEEPVKIYENEVQL